MTTDFYEYVPPDEWQTLNALEGFSQNSLEPTDALAGRSFDLRLNGKPWRLTVGAGHQLGWAPVESFGGEAAPPRHPYMAREVLPGVFLIEFQDAADPSTAVTMLLDHELAALTTVTTTVAPDGDSWRVRERVDHGVLGDEGNPRRHERTDEMVGHRVQYIYGPGHSYEHIYLNASTYVWHCLGGAERGQADAEYSQAYKIRDDVYLFMWRERIVPCDGVLVIDWVNLRSNGRIFGWDTDEERHNLIRMGARAVPLNTTRYAQFEE
jgi:hypothetical protein